MAMICLIVLSSTYARLCNPSKLNSRLCEDNACMRTFGQEFCTKCKSGSVPINGPCLPVNFPNVTKAGCTQRDGSPLPDTATECGKCGAGYLLFMGGCYPETNSIAKEVCQNVQDSLCKQCKTSGGVFKNPSPSPTPGRECILCSDVVGADGYRGVEGCNYCSAPASSDVVKCTNCAPEYYLISQKSTCAKCLQGCGSCHEETKDQCESCELDYYSTPNKKCVDENNCGSGYYADQTTSSCTKCETTLQNCLACSLNKTSHIPVCTSCKGPMLLKILSDGSASCVESSQCSSGSDYFANASINKCVLCGDTANGGIEGCKQCTLTGTKVTCSKCSDGYTQISKSGNPVTCTSCGKNCATCDSSGKCATCQAGHFMNDTTSKECVSCGDTSRGGVEGCTECSKNGDLTCTKCKPNYYDPASNKCTKRCEDDASCGRLAFCNAKIIANKVEKNYCSRCDDLSMYPINGKCTKDKAGNTCTNGICTKCAPGYILFRNGCYSLSASPGSLLCAEVVGGVCTVAAKGYVAPSENREDIQAIVECGDVQGTVIGDEVYIGLDECVDCVLHRAASSAVVVATTCVECNLTSPNSFLQLFNETTGAATCMRDSECGTGYFVEKKTNTGPYPNGKCIRCASVANGGIAGCSQCTLTNDKVGTCTACSPGKKLGPSKRVCLDACPANSKENPPGTCQCDTDSFPSADGTRCEKGQDCSGSVPGGCSKCNSAGECLQCMAGKHVQLSGAGCTDSCPQNSTPVNGRCVCSLEYATSKDRTACIRRWPCSVSGCSTCLASVCLRCVDGSYLTSIGKCVEDCTAIGGFFNRKDGKCAACDAACRTCDGHGPGSCTSCPAGRALKYSGSHGTCEDQRRASQNGCQVCGASISGTAYCSQCSDSGQAPLNGECQGSARSATVFCTSISGGKCTMCADGYFLFAGGCYKTDRQPGRDVCTGAENGQCKTCASGLPATSGDCTSQRCHKSCATCSDTTESGCKTCSSGYYKKADAGSSGRCTPCSTVMTGCIFCAYLQERAECLEVRSDPQRPGLGVGGIAGIALAIVLIIGGATSFLCWWFLIRGKAAHLDLLNAAR